MFSKLTLCLFLLTNFVISSPIYATDNSAYKECLEIVESIISTIDTPLTFESSTKRGIRDLSDKRMKEKGSKALTQKDVELDEYLYKDIKGEDAPGIFKNLMVDGVRFIDHELYLNARDGLVKLNDGGDFVSFRADIPFKGKNYATNIGLNKRFFVSNYENKSKSLVSEEAKAVVIFMHGGGTKTTGHHVAANISNHLVHYDVDVIALDMPWHAEGPREHFANSEEFVGWLRAFLDKYIKDSGKPVFLAGHSMGGEMANIYLRAAKKDDEWIDGVISLSPPVDPSPEVKDAREKLSEIAKMWEDIQIGGDYKEDEEDLETLLRLKDKFTAANREINDIENVDEGILDETTFDGKNNPIGILFEQIITVANSWKIPEHKGDDYLPALFAWGKYDYLLSGKYFDYIDEYIAPLTNVDLKLYGHRETVDEKIKKIGHLIFDHYDLEKEGELETFVDVRRFISKVIGEDLPLQGGNTGKSSTQMLANLVREYAINLDFRAFVDVAIIEKKIPVDPVTFQELSKSMKEHLSIIKGKSSSPEEKLVAQEKYNIVRDRISGTFVPEGEAGAKGRELKEKIVSLEKEYNKYPKPYKKLIKFYSSFAPRMGAKERKLNQLIKQAVKDSSDSKIEQLAKEYEDAKDLLVKETMKVNKEVDKHIDRVLSLKEKVTQEDLVPSQTLYKTFREYEYEYFEGIFQQKRKAYEDYLYELAGEGKLGSEVQTELISFYSEKKFLRELTLAIDLLENKTLVLQKEINKVKRQITEMYSSNVWKFETIALKDIFDGDVENIAQKQGVLQEFWKHWKAIQ